METHIIINSDTTLPSITPADSLLYLELRNNFIFDTNGLLLDYMTAKYRCLSELYFTFNDEYDSYEFSNYHDVDGGDLFSDSDDDSDEEDIRRYTQIYKSLQRDFETTLAVYNQSGSKLFSSNNPKLKSLAIRNDAFGNTLQTLSSSDMQLVSLNHEDAILNVDQLDYIRQLKYLKTLHITVTISNIMNVPIISLSSITSLTITKLGQPTDIQWLFSTFPSLEALDMRESFIWNTPNDINNGSTLRFPNLLNLIANVPFFDQNSFDFLSLIAPNIEVLDLTFKMTTPITIDISNWKLKKMCLKTFNRGFQDYSYYKINTPHANEILKVDTTNGAITFIGDRALEFADTEPLMLHITSTIDKRFMFYKYGLSLTQNQITLSSPT